MEGEGVLDPPVETASTLRRTPVTSTRPLFAALAAGRSLQEIAKAAGLDVRLTKRILLGKTDPLTSHTRGLRGALGCSFEALDAALQEAGHRWKVEEAYSANRTPEQARRAAHHEGSHLAAAITLQVPYAGASIIPQRHRDGSFSAARTVLRPIRAKAGTVKWRDRLRREVLVLIAGDYGEMVLSENDGVADMAAFLRADCGSGHDEDEIRRILPMVCEAGEDFMACRARLYDRFWDVRQCIRPLIVPLAEALLARERLSWREAEMIACGVPSTEAA